MSGRALERMRSLLNGTGAYRLDGTGSADWETDACGAGFTLVEQAADKLLGDLFPDTASQEALDRWEKLYRSQKAAGPLEDRRAVLAARLAIRPGRFSPGDFSPGDSSPKQGNPMVRAAGVEAALQETEEGLRVALGRLLGVTEAEARRELDQILPAHLLWTWDDSITWEALDAWLPSFGSLDGRELTWEQADALTREQLEQWGEEREYGGVG